jgi:hypothetical protein
MEHPLTLWDQELYIWIVHRVNVRVFISSCKLSHISIILGMLENVNHLWLYASLIYRRTFAP